MTRFRFDFLIWFLLLFGSVFLLSSLSIAESRWNALMQESHTLQEQGKREEALGVAKKALDIAENDFGLGHANTAKSLNNIAVIIWELGCFDEVMPLYQRALGISKKNEVGQYAGLLDQIGRSYEAQGNYSKAEKYFKMTYFLYKKRYSPHAFEMASPLGNLARIYKKQKQYPTALSFYNKKLYIEKKLGGPDSILVGYVYEDIADIYLAQGQYSKALRTYEHALKIREKSGNLNEEMGADLLEGLSKTHSKISKDLLKKAQKIRKETMVENK